MMVDLNCLRCKTPIARTDGATLENVGTLPGELVNALIRCPACGATRMWRPVATYPRDRRRSRHINRPPDRETEPVDITPARCRIPVLPDVA